MNRKQWLLAVLYCFILVGSVTASSLERQDDPASVEVADVADIDENGLQDSLGGSYKKPSWKEKVFVEVDFHSYYWATIYNKGGKIQISIVNEESRCFELEFMRYNEVVFIDAYQNYIVVKEVNDYGDVLSYFVLIIVYDTKACKFYLDFFAVSSRVDSTFWKVQEGFQITRILELDVYREFLVVVLENKEYLDVYKINIAEKINVLTEPRWFEKKGAVITGGNYRVLFNKAENEFLVDTLNCLPGPGVPAIYKSVPVCSLTSYPLFDYNRIYNLLGNNFQYVSRSRDRRSMTTFLYRGYGNLQPLGRAFLKSRTPIKIIYDDYNFFIAITDCDIYLSNVIYDFECKEYRYFADLLSNTGLSHSEKAEAYKDWSGIEAIVFLDGKFYFISCGKFFVYGIKPDYFTKLYENNCVYDGKDLHATLLKEIEDYKCKN